jgi:hypothetical protein
MVSAAVGAEEFYSTEVWIIICINEKDLIVGSFTLGTLMPFRRCWACKRIGL